MPIHYLFTLKKGADPELAEEELHHLGIENLYILEDPDSDLIQMGGYLPEELPPLATGTFYEMVEKTQDVVDWEKQWESFSHGYHDGIATINLEAFGKEGLFKLIPGEGFGDLSHPTTRLCLQLLCSHFTSQPIIDVGCGSGVLAIAAKTLGAKEVYALDIDEKALEHTRKNMELNHITDLYIGNKLPFNFEKKALVLINMTLKEQKDAWNAIAYQLNAPYHVIASGILASQLAPYKKEIEKRGWTILSMEKEGDWLALYCEGKPFISIYKKL